MIEGADSQAMYVFPQSSSFHMVSVILAFSKLTYTVIEPHNAWDWSHYAMQVGSVGL